MATEYQWYVIAVTDSLAIGNRLGQAIDPNPGGNRTFTDGAALRPIGSQSTTPTRWAAAIALRQTGRDACAEFETAGPYPVLNARGLSDAEIAIAKPHVWYVFGPRESIEGTAVNFIASLGYEIIPEA